MTDNQVIAEAPHHPPQPTSDRTFPECQCPADCGGRPEALLRLTAAYSQVSEMGIKPPAAP